MIPSSVMIPPDCRYRPWRICFGQGGGGADLVAISAALGVTSTVNGSGHDSIVLSAIGNAASGSFVGGGAGNAPSPLVQALFLQVQPSMVVVEMMFWHSVQPLLQLALSTKSSVVLVLTPLVLVESPVVAPARFYAALSESTSLLSTTSVLTTVPLPSPFLSLLSVLLLVGFWPMLISALTLVVWSPSSVQSAAT